MKKRELKRRLRKSEKTLQQWSDDYKRRQSSDKLISAAKEQYVIMTIDGGFLLSNRKGTTLNAPIKFYATPAELCEALQAELGLAALTR